MNDEVYLWHADKHRNLLQVDTIHFGCVQPGMPKIPKIRSLDIFAISPEKHAGGGGGGGGGGGEDDFLPVNENESFVQVDSITMGLRR